MKVIALMVALLASTISLSGQLPHFDWPGEGQGPSTQYPQELRDAQSHLAQFRTASSAKTGSECFPYVVYESILDTATQTWDTTRYLEYIQSGDAIVGTHYRRSLGQSEWESLLRFRISTTQFPWGNAPLASLTTETLEEETSPGEWELYFTTLIGQNASEDLLYKCRLAINPNTQQLDTLDVYTRKVTLRPDGQSEAIFDQTKVFYPAGNYLRTDATEFTFEYNARDTLVKISRTHYVDYPNVDSRTEAEYYGWQDYSNLIPDSVLYRWNDAGSANSRQTRKWIHVLEHPDRQINIDTVWTFTEVKNSSDSIFQFQSGQLSIIDSTRIVNAYGFQRYDSICYDPQSGPLLDKYVLATTWEWHDNQCVLTRTRRSETTDFEGPRSSFTRAEWAYGPPAPPSPPGASFRITPNPSFGEFDLYFQNLHGPVEASIYDPTGKLALQRQWLLVEDLEIHPLSLPIANGVYLLRVVSGDFNDVQRLLVR